MNIELISIAKKEKTLYDPLYKDLIKMISKYANFQDTELFPKEITKAHSISPKASQLAYSKLLEPYIMKDYSVVLHPEGKIIDSYEFSKLLSDKMSIKFFIGGAYGFDEEFTKKGNVLLSLGKITMSHKIAKAVLLEQIYRGFSILNNHPYHK